MSRSTQVRLYVGTYTHGRKGGIPLCHFDMSSGALELVGVAAETQDPSFLAFDPQERYLYAVNELGEYEGQPTGTVSAYAVDAATGGLTFLNRQPSQGAAPCYVQVDASGRYVLVANFMSGTLCALPVQTDGSLGAPSDWVQHVDADGQRAAHAHCILPDLRGTYFLSADLGLDSIWLYRLDLEQGKLRSHTIPWVATPSGAGPRHIVFHPSGRFVYVINELGSSVSVYAYDGQRGVLDELQTLSALPADFAGKSYCADLHLAPSGRFLYGSNRGHDSIVIYAVDGDTGRLMLVGHEPTGGKWPRNFAIDPSGNWLLVANQHSNNIVVFRLDARTGQLCASGTALEVPEPVCLRFATPVL